MDLLFKENEIVASCYEQTKITKFNKDNNNNNVKKENGKNESV